MTTDVRSRDATDASGETAPPAGPHDGEPPRHRDDDAAAPGRVERLRAALASLFLVVLVLVQQPGTVSADTKLDLYVDPGELLRRALSLWDPSAAAGQLQNQAYGYLFPMGPFFALGHLLGLPAWLVQRLWWCLLLLTAFHGTRLLLRRLHVGSPTSVLVAALAYALSPRLLGALGGVSIEVWPMAVAPWVLLPLVRVPPGTERRRAAWSAVAVACIGGVNAVATAAVLPLPALWLLRGLVRRSRGGRARGAADDAGRRPAARLAGWWLLLVALACTWWAVPLLLLGRYSPPFLDWIESAEVTTRPASLPEALRGTTAWIAGISGSGGPQWPAAYQVLTTRTAVVGGLVVALAGVAGLASRSLRHGLFWRVGLVAGLALVTLGHTGSLHAPWAAGVQDLLDGAGAPLRNVHKFEVVVRLPLVVGLAHLLGRTELLRRRLPLLAGLTRFVVVCCLVCLTAPAALVGVAQRGAFTTVPDWWRATAGYLAAQPQPGRTLVLPGASFAASYWGDTRDEPLQPLARTPWIVRDGVPLGSGGATRLLNRVEQVVQSGHGGTELAGLLEELDVTRVVQRSDLDWRSTGAPPPLVVRQALASTPGLSPVRTFGPLVGGSSRADVAFDDGIDQAVPTIQVWSTATSGAAAQLLPAAAVAVRSGGSEQPAAGPSVLADDAASVAAVRAAGGAGSGVVTDTLQRREATFSVVRDVYGPPLAAGQAYTADRAGHDWWPSGTDPASGAGQTTALTQGVRAVTASSSLATPLLGAGRDLSASPYAALDRDAATSWVSSRPATGQWWSVDLDTPVTLPASVPLVLDEARGADVSWLQVSTDQGRVRTPVDPSPDRPGASAAPRAVLVDVPAGPTRHLSVRALAVRGDQHRPLALADVAPDVLPQAVRVLAMPAAPGRTSAVVVGEPGGRRDACAVDATGIARCQPSRARAGEEAHRLDRSFVVQGAGTFTVTGLVRPRYGAALDHLLDGGGGAPAVGASSTWVDDAVVRPGAVQDGDPRTYWAPAADDPAPTLRLRYPAPHEVSGVVVATDPRVTGSRPSVVRVRLGSRTVTRSVSLDGQVRLPRTRTRTVTVTVVSSERVTSIGSVLGARPLPVVIGELRVVGAPPARSPAADSATGAVCGFGPSLVVDGRAVPTRVTALRSQVLTGSPVQLEACRPVTLGAGPHRITLTASGEFETGSLRFTRSTAAAAGAASATTDAVPVTWGSTSRSVRVPAASAGRLLVVRENANPGWTATTASGRHLRSLVLDGWEQAFVLPAGTAGTVHLVYAPQRPYEVGLLVGALALLLVVVLALWRPRRRAVAPELLAQRPAEDGSRQPHGGWSARLARVAASLLPPVAGLVLAGWWGLLVGLVTGLLVGRQRWRAPVLVLVSAALCALCAWAPWPAAPATNRDAAAQLLAVAALSCALAPAARRPRRRPGQAGESPQPAEPGTGRPAG